MSVQSKTMSSVLLFLNLLFLVSHEVVDAFHVDKPMIYINFFDEVVSDNASSKFINKALTTTSTPSNNSAKDIRKKLDLSAELLKLNDENENKTSASVPFDSIFDFDMPSKADITEISVNESDVDRATSTEFSDLMDPEFLEPEITRMFFLKAIASLIEHIMEALFTIDDTPKLSESPGFDYELAPSRNPKKRDLSNAEGIAKLKDADQGIENKTEFKTNSSVDIGSKMVSLKTDDLETKKNNTGQTVLSNLTHENIVETITELSSHAPSTLLVSDHVSSQHGSNKATVNKSHSNKRDNDAKSITGVKSEQEIKDLPEGKVVHRGKFIANKNLPAKLSSVDEDNMKMFHFSDESSVLNDEVVNKKDTRFYGGIHPAEDHDELLENYTGEEVKKVKSTFIVTVFLVGTTALILMILGALALAAGYFFRKSQESENQNDTNLRSAVA